MPHICVSNLTIIGSDNGLSPGRRQAIIWNYAEMFLIETSVKFLSNAYIFCQENTFETVVCEMGGILSRLQCLKRRLEHVIGAVPMTSQILTYNLSRDLLRPYNIFHFLQRGHTADYMTIRRLLPPDAFLFKSVAVI